MSTAATTAASRRPRQAAAGTSPVNLRSLLDEMIKRGASDLHITAGERPKLRIDGDITNASTDYVLTPKDTLQIAYTLLTESQKKRFEVEDELDFSLRHSESFALPRQRVQAAAVCLDGRTSDSVPDQDVRAAGTSRRSSPRSPRSPRGLVLVDRSDRLGQVDDARRDDRQDQPRMARPHPDRRRPDRVRAQASGLHREPARSRRGHEVLCVRRSSTRCVRTRTSY